MALVVPDEGEVALLDMLVNGDTLANAELRLYENNLTPDEDTVYGDFNEATFTGYAAQTPTFGSASIVSHKGSISDTATRDFVCSTAGTPDVIYGYYVVDAVNNLVLWAERFASPITIAAAGDTISINLVFTEDSEN